MFLDDLLSYNEKILRKIEVRLQNPPSNVPETLLPKGGSLVDVYKSQQSIRKKLIDILQNSKLFLLNGAVVDDLYHVPHEVTNYEATMHLPFPTIFFELMDTLEIPIQVGNVKSLRGMLYGHAKDVDFSKLYSDIQDLPSDYFMIHLFYSNFELEKGSSSPDSIIFRTSALPQFGFLTDYYFYKYDPVSGVSLATDDGLKNSFTQNSKAIDLYEKRKPEDPRRLKENFEHLLDLCVNVVDYINAHNITIRKTDRQKNIDRINRKRLKKGKKLLKPLKPYYWVDIKRHVVDNWKGESIGKMDYREWVRGHFQRYHIKKETLKHWIQPYIRGPELAPWKENRYRVLDDMLKKGPSYKVIK